MNYVEAMIKQIFLPTLEMVSILFIFSGLSRVIFTSAEASVLMSGMQSHLFQASVPGSLWMLPLHVSLVVHFSRFVHLGELCCLCSRAELLLRGFVAKLKYCPEQLASRPVIMFIFFIKVITLDKLDHISG